MQGREATKAKRRLKPHTRRRHRRARRLWQNSFSSAIHGTKVSANQPIVPCAEACNPGHYAPPISTKQVIDQLHHNAPPFVAPVPDASPCRMPSIRPRKTRAVAGGPNVNIVIGQSLCAEAVGKKTPYMSRESGGVGGLPLKLCDKRPPYKPLKLASHRNQPQQPGVAGLTCKSAAAANVIILRKDHPVLIGHGAAGMDAAQDICRPDHWPFETGFHSFHIERSTDAPLEII